MKCLFPDLPYNSKVDAAAEKTTEELMRVVGANTGNLMFRHAIRTQLADALHPCSFQGAVERAEKEKYDAVVVAAANWLHSAVPFGNRHRAECLRQINLPTICIGLGCQHPHPTMEKLDFNEETRELLKALADLDAYVLVRDEMTFAQCRHYGLKHVFLIGCPSNFINHDPFFAETLTERARKTAFPTVTLNVGFNTEPILAHDIKLLPLVLAGAGRCVIQTDFQNIAAVARGRNEEYSAADVRNLKRAFKMRWSLKRFGSPFRDFQRRMSLYFDVPRWLEDAGGWDFVLGSRVHGAMAALQACTPTLLTTIDSRTQGLAEQMQIPHIHLKDTERWADGVTLAEILAEQPLDFSAYVARRAALARDYAQTLQAFGLSLTASFEQMVASQVPSPGHAQTEETL